MIFANHKLFSKNNAAVVGLIIISLLLPFLGSFFLDQDAKSTKNFPEIILYIPKISGGVFTMELGSNDSVVFWILIFTMVSWIISFFTIRNEKAIMLNVTALPGILLIFLMGNDMNYLNAVAIYFLTTVANFRYFSKMGEEEEIWSLKCSGLSRQP